MEAFTNAISLRALGLGFAVVDVLNGEIEFILVMFPGATVLRSPVSENA
jgi:hypothetical protein